MPDSFRINASLQNFSRKADVKVMSASELRGLLEKLLTAEGAKTVACLTIKKDGSPRRWVIGPKHGRDQIKGEKPPAPLPANLRRVFDLSVAQAREKGRFQKVTHNGWRTIDLDAVVAVRRGNVVYSVDSF